VKREIAHLIVREALITQTSAGPHRSAAGHPPEGRAVLNMASGAVPEDRPVIHRRTDGPLILIKIGGSAITNKSGHEELKVSLCPPRGPDR
jgi:hypothetical protein